MGAAMDFTLDSTGCERRDFMVASSAASDRLELDGSRRVQRFGALEHRGADESADAAAGDSGGAHSAPSNQTLIGLALVLTYFLMQPVGTSIYQVAVVPFQLGQVDALEAVERGAPPLRHFMLKYAREKDLALFLELAQVPRPARADEVPMRVVVPAYILSELKTGFQIGVALFLPFLVIDLVVAAVTTSIGMMQLPPVIISTPLKILLFVMVDGWNLLVGSLMKSFA